MWGRRLLLECKLLCAGGRRRRRRWCTRFPKRPTTKIYAKPQQILKIFSLLFPLSTSFFFPCESSPVRTNFLLSTSSTAERGSSSPPLHSLKEGLGPKACATGRGGRGGRFLFFRDVAGRDTAASKRGKSLVSLLSFFLFLPPFPASFLLDFLPLLQQFLFLLVFSLLLLPPPIKRQADRQTERKKGAGY